MVDPALLIGCRAAQSLVKQVAEEVSKSDGVRVVEPCDLEVEDFPNTELLPKLGGSVRGRHVLLIQCSCAFAGKNVDSALQEFLLTLDALFRASAAKITGILPMFPYQRQERKHRARFPISAKRIALNIESAMGSVSEKRVVSIDLHSPVIQGFFEIPVESLYADTELAPHLAAAGYWTVVSPDSGGMPRAEQYLSLLEDYRDALGEDQDVEMTGIYKRRKSPRQVTPLPWVAGAHIIKDRSVAVVDDVLSTGGSAREAGLKCRELGASRVGLAVTHAECSEDALTKIHGVFDDVWFTDSLPPERLPQPLPANVHIVSVAPLLATAIRQIVHSGSVSGLDGRRQYDLVRAQVATQQASASSVPVPS